MNSALVAGPPSPEKPRAPVPASVEMAPVAAVSTRMRLLLLESAMARSPLGRSARLVGLLSSAKTAAPPSPPKPWAPVPATVSTIGALVGAAEGDAVVVSDGVPVCVAVTLAAVAPAAATASSSAARADERREPGGISGGRGRCHGWLAVLAIGASARRSSA